jgi:hypothetical protein
MMAGMGGIVPWQRPARVACRTSGLGAFYVALGQVSPLAYGTCPRTGHSETRPSRRATLRGDRPVIAVVFVGAGNRA